MLPNLGFNFAGKKGQGYAPSPSETWHKTQKQVKKGTLWNLPHWTVARCRTVLAMFGKHVTFVCSKCIFS